MKPYEKNTKSQVELFKIISSLEALERNYRIITTKELEGDKWVRAWNVEEFEVSL